MFLDQFLLISLPLSHKWYHPNIESVISEEQCLLSASCYPNETGPPWSLLLCTVGWHPTVCATVSQGLWPCLPTACVQNIHGGGEGRGGREAQSEASAGNTSTLRHGCTPCTLRRLHGRAEPSCCPLSGYRQAACCPAQEATPSHAGDSISKNSCSSDFFLSL